MEIHVILKQVYVIVQLVERVFNVNKVLIKKNIKSYNQYLFKIVQQIHLV
jgi:hypothetical protein